MIPKKLHVLEYKKGGKWLIYQNQYAWAWAATSADEMRLHGLPCAKDRSPDCEFRISTYTPTRSKP